MPVVHKPQHKRGVVGGEGFALSGGAVFLPAAARGMQHLQPHAVIFPQHVACMKGLMGKPRRSKGGAEQAFIGWGAGQAVSRVALHAGVAQRIDEAVQVVGIRVGVGDDVQRRGHAPGKRGHHQ